jgi:integrase
LAFLSADTLAKIDLLSNGDPDAVLFNSSENTLGHMVSRFFKARGVKLSSHDFRKTRATNLYRYEGWTLLQIAAYLGHADIRTT